MIENQIFADLKSDEGFRSKLYYCTAGKATIGYGLNLEAGITEEEAAWILRRRIEKLEQELKLKIPRFTRYPDGVKRALVNMAYQMGVSGVLGFKNTLRMIDEGKYEEAAQNALKSKWATKDTPQRAKRVTNWIKNAKGN